VVHATVCRAQENIANAVPSRLFYQPNSFRDFCAVIVDAIKITADKPFPVVLIFVSSGAGLDLFLQF
jgi:hypothetical protein